MPDVPQAPSPPAMGNCVTTLQSAQPGAPPQQTSYQLTRSGDGKIRVDSGSISVITDPATQRTILLDHLHKEATSLSAGAPQPPGMQVPGMPQFTSPGLAAGAPAAPSMNIKDLGKQMIAGEMAEGKRITFQPPNVPGVQPPGMPGAPQLPGAPQSPQAPQPPTVAELWTNPNLHLPVLTQVQGPFGQQTCKCSNKAIAEPDPTMFQIPKDYKDLTPPAPPTVPQK